jgi:hypothetical protein
MTETAIPVQTTATTNGTNSKKPRIRHHVCAFPTAYPVSPANFDIDACQGGSGFSRNQRKRYDRSNHKDLEHLFSPIKPQLLKGTSNIDPQSGEIAPNESPAAPASGLSCFWAGGFRKRL